MVGVVSCWLPLSYNMCVLKYEGVMVFFLHSQSSHEKAKNFLIERYGVCLIIWRAGKTKTKWKGYGNIQPQASDQWTTVSAARMQHCSSCKVWRASRSLWPGTLHCVVVWFVTRTLLSLEPGFASSTNQRYNLKDFCGWLKGLSGPMATLLMLPFTGPYKEFNAEG